MYLTSSVRIEPLNVDGFMVNLFGFEPMFVPDSIVAKIKQHPLMHFVLAENEPKAYKKRYFKGCLKGGEKLLVCRYGGIGDIMWVLPCVREIKARFPNIKVRFACFEKDRELIYNCEFIDEIITTPFPMVSDMEWCDFCLDFYDTVEGVGDATARVRNPIDINEEIIGYRLANYLPFYRVSSKEEKVAEAKLIGFGLTGREKLIGMPLFASSPHRQWNKHVELIKKLVADKNVRVIVFGKEGNTEPISQGISEMGPQVINMINKTTIREMVALLSKCDVIFSNDTGMVHICGGALSKPTVAIYTTVPKETRTSHYPTVTGLQAKCECSPCYKLSEPCEFGEKCLNTITVDEVYLQIQEELCRTEKTKVSKI